MKKLLFLFVFASAFNVFSQEAILLRVNYEVGDILLVEQDVSQKMGAQGGVDMKIVMGVTITAKDGDTISSASKIKSIDMNMLQGGNVMSFDSSKNEEDLDEMGKMMKQQFDPMMKATIFSKMSSDGDILETKVEPATPAMDQFTKQAKGIKFPKKEVTVGSSWEDTTNEQGMDVKTIYTISKIESGKAYVDIKGVVSGVGEGTLAGDLIIDISTGIQELVNIEMDLNANGVEMTIVTKGKTTKI
jgi:hypothetical protein